MHLADIVSVMLLAGFAVLHIHGCYLLLVIAISTSYSPLSLVGVISYHFFKSVYFVTIIPKLGVATQSKH